MYIGRVISLNFRNVLLLINNDWYFGLISVITLAPVKDHIVLIIDLFLEIINELYTSTYRSAT